MNWGGPPPYLGAVGPFGYMGELISTYFG